MEAVTSIIYGPTGKIDFPLVYASCLSIGLPPSEVDRLGMLQLFDLLDAHHRIHKPGNKLSRQEADDLWDWL